MRAVDQCLVDARRDRIFVLGSGELLESGTPAELLSRPGSVLSSLVRVHGHESEAALRKLAGSD